MNRKTIVATGIATAVVLAAGGGLAYSAMNNRVAVGTAVAAAGPLEVTVSASGSLVAARTAGVYPPAAGTLAKVLVHDGDAVRAGSTLGVLAKGPLKLAVAEALAAHTAAQAQLEAVDNGVPAAIERSAAGAALTAARSQVASATKNYTAFLRDYRDADSPERKIMRPTLRTLRTAKAQARSALKAAQAGLSRLSAAARVTLARRAAAQAVTASGKALDLAETNLAKAELTAPFAGTVRLNGTVEKGAGVTPGVAPFTVVDPTRMEFEAMVNETDIAAVAKGQPVTVSLDAYASDGFAGKVGRVQAAASTTATGSVAFPVRIAFEAGGATLYAGMSGAADITVESIPDALTVPVESVVSTDSGQVVFVVGPDDIVHSRPVEVGAASDTAVQVLTGLAAGDRVVTTGATGLADGQRVSPN